VEAHLPLEPEPQPEKEEGVILFDRVLRYFVRSTHISESVIRMKLGARSNTFFIDCLTPLLDHGIFVEIETKSGPQRRFRLGVLMAVLIRALDSCGGSFARLVDIAAPGAGTLEAH